MTLRRGITARIWNMTKEICRIKQEAKNFKSSSEIRKYVRDNKHLLPEVVNGWSTK